MKINLKRTLSKEVESSYKWEIEYLTVEGIELKERLKPRGDFCEFNIRVIK